MPSSSFLAPAWSFLLDKFSIHFLNTWGLFILHELSYWLSFVPFAIFDQIPSLQRYKLQPEKPATRPQVSYCALRVLLNHFLLVLPIILITHPIFALLGCTTTITELPTISTVLIQLVIFFVVEDFVFYWGHRLLHTPYLYTKVHSVHHHHSAPFGIAAEYAHPFEVVFLGFATLAGPLIVGPHLATLYIYLGLRCFQTVECHSGYDLPYSPRRWIPGYGGAEFHDHHHRIHSGNYASTFIWTDWLYGTDQAYKLWRKATNKVSEEQHAVS